MLTIDRINLVMVLQVGGLFPLLIINVTVTFRSKNFDIVFLDPATTRYM